MSPLGPKRNRGNLFCLARLSSNREAALLLVHCIAPLGLFSCLILSSFFPLKTFSLPHLDSSFLHCHRRIKQGFVYVPAWLHGVLLVMRSLKDTDFTKGICLAQSIFFLYYPCCGINVDL